MGKIIWFILGGMACGLLLVHPAVRLAYAVQHLPPSVSRDYPFIMHQLRRAFGPDLMPIGLAFAVLGGGVGFILGSWFRAKQRLQAENLVCLKSLTALETLKELMVTLAHYIRNANIVVGGFSARLVRHISDPELRRDLGLIREASQEIDAVITSLQRLTEIKTVEYDASSHAQMIDLKRDLEALLAKAASEEAREE